MGVSPTNLKQQAAIPLFGHTQILHMLISMGSTALAAAVVPGMVAWITRVGLMKIKKERMSRCIIFYIARVKILRKKKKGFIYHQMYHGD